MPVRMRRGAVSPIPGRGRGDSGSTSETPSTTRPFDHLVGPQEQRWWNRQAQGAGRFGVDHELEFRGLLDGEIAGLGCRLDASDESSSTAWSFPRKRRAAPRFLTGAAMPEELLNGADVDLVLGDTCGVMADGLRYGIAASRSRAVAPRSRASARRPCRQTARVLHEAVLGAREVRALDRAARALVRLHEGIRDRRGHVSSISAWPTTWAAAPPPRRKRRCA